MFSKRRFERAAEERPLMVPSAVDGFSRITYLGNNMWELKGAAVTMTGSDITTTYGVPYTHDLLVWEFVHTDSANAASEDIISYALFYEDEGVFRVLWSKDNKSLRYGMLTYSPERRMEGTRYRSILNSTNTDLVYEKFVVRIIAGGSGNRKWL